MNECDERHVFEMGVSVRSRIDNASFGSCGVGTGSEHEIVCMNPGFASVRVHCQSTVVGGAVRYEKDVDSWESTILLPPARSGSVTARDRHKIELVDGAKASVDALETSAEVVPIHGIGSYKTERPIAIFVRI